MTPKTTLFGLGALTLAAVLGAVVLHDHHRAPREATAGIKTFEVRGQVRAVDATGKILTVAHEEIPDYMPAMTMPLPVKEASLLSGLSPGDAVQFRLVVTKNDSWIDRIERIPSGTPTEATGDGQSPASLQDLEVERVQVGELVPDFKLIDQEGRPVRLSDFRGQAVLLTFIYTRCPLPNFCPLMSKNFADLNGRLGKEFPSRYHLLSITMDPEFDQPEVLKAYAARYQAEASTWSFATGSADQIRFVAGLMGLYYTWEGGLISHDLRTALIGPDGRFVHLWKSNVWTPYEIERAVRESLSGKERTGDGSLGSEV